MVVADQEGAWRPRLVRPKRVRAAGASTYPRGFASEKGNPVSICESKLPLWSDVHEACDRDDAPNCLKKIYRPNSCFPPPVILCLSFMSSNGSAHESDEAGRDEVHSFVYPVKSLLSGIHTRRSSLSTAITSTHGISADGGERVAASSEAKIEQLNSTATTISDGKVGGASSTHSCSNLVFIK